MKKAGDAAGGRVVWGMFTALVLVGWVPGYFTSDDFMRTWSVAWEEPHPKDPAQKVHEASGNWVLSSEVGSIGIWEMQACWRM